MNFDFLNEHSSGSSPASRSRGDGETFEDRDPGMVDDRGRRITYSIRRITHRQPPYQTMHLRWIYVLKDDEIVREIDSNSHDTHEEAEAWVEDQIARLATRSARRSAPRAAARPVGRRKSGGWRFVLLVLAIIAIAPFVAGLFITAAIPH